MKHRLVRPDRCQSTPNGRRRWSIAAPHPKTTNRLPAPPSPTEQQPNRTANSQGSLDQSQGPRAVSSLGAPPHTTNGPDPTNSAGGSAGEDGRPPALDRPPLLQRVADCEGFYRLPPVPLLWWHRMPVTEFYPGMEIPARAHFFRGPDGMPWITFSFPSGNKLASNPVRVLGSESGITWTGGSGTTYTLRPAVYGHLTGTAGPPGGGAIDLYCAGGRLPFS